MNLQKTQMKTQRQMSNNINQIWKTSLREDTENQSREMLLKIGQVFKEILAVNTVVSKGYISVFNIKPQGWDRDLVKEWISKECRGKSEFGLYHCAFELQSDASNFILTWT